MARTLTISNQKGGVGKTTSTINIAACLAESGRNVLVVDLDPQANCTSGLGIHPREVKRSVYDVLSPRKLSAGCAMADAIRHTRWPRLDVVPSHVDLGRAELELANRIGREAVLKKALRPVRDRFDYILLDTPPSLSLLTVNALAAVDDVIISMLAEPWSLEGIEHLLGTIGIVRGDMNPGITLRGVIVIIPEPEPPGAAEVMAKLKADERLRDQVLETTMRWNTDIAAAAAAEAPVIHVDGAGEGAQAFRRLTREILVRLGDERGDERAEAAESTRGVSARAARPRPRRTGAARPAPSPAASSPAGPSPAASSPAAPSPVVPGPVVPAPAIPVLVVDDQADSRELLRDLLSEAGHAPLLAADGGEALHLLQDHSVGLVVTDVHMPGIDGMELLERIHAGAPDMPVIVFSGDSRPSLGMRAFSRGAYYFLEKPIQSARFLALIDEAMKGSRPSPDAAAASDEKAPGSRSGGEAAAKTPATGTSEPQVPAGGASAVPPVAPAEPGRGLEDAIVGSTTVGSVDGAGNLLVYGGYDAVELAAKSSFEETSYLLLHGRLPLRAELDAFSARLRQYRRVPPEVLAALRVMPMRRVEPMSALRTAVSLLGTLDEPAARPTVAARGEAAVKLIAQLPTLTAAIGRLRSGAEPLDPDPGLSHAADLARMLTGATPDPDAERLMDASLILHADHGMNAATFSAIVTGSSLPDIYSAVIAGLCSLKGNLQVPAGEEALRMLDEIGSRGNVATWLRDAVRSGRTVLGVGHRVFQEFDPRARFLAPLVGQMAESRPEIRRAWETARELERVLVTLPSQRARLFANVDLYSGIAYRGIGIDPAMFAPLLAVSRVTGWVARVLEYQATNHIVRPQDRYVGPAVAEYVPIAARG